MIDLKKSDGGELIRSELRELTTTNQRLKTELETTRHKLNGELDTLTYRLERINQVTQDIRRDVHEIRRDIDKLRYDLLDAIRNVKSSEGRDLIWNLFPIFAMLFPSLLIAGIIMIAVIAG